MLRIVINVALLWIGILSLTACNRGDLESPGTEFLRAHTVDPLVGDLLQELRRAIDEGTYQEAMILADSIGKLAPGLAEVPYLRGIVFSKIQALDSASVSFLQAAALDPNYRGAFFEAGQAQFMKGQFRKAIDMYQKEYLRIEESNRDASAYYREVDRKALPTIFLQLGRAYQLMGMADSTRFYYERSLLLDSLNATAHSWMAEYYKDAGENETGLFYVRRAVELNPASLESRVLLGILLIRNKKPEEALPVLQSVIHERPTHLTATYNLGLAYGALGQESEAEVYIKRAAQLEDLISNMSKAEDAVSVLPGQTDRWITLADYYLAAGRMEDALKALDVAAYLSPGNLKVRSDIANLHLALGDTSAALKGFEAVIHRDSSFADGWLNLGVVYAMLGQKEQARQAWKNVLRYRSGDEQVKEYLARLDDR